MSRTYDKRFAERCESWIWLWIAGRRPVTVEARMRREVKLLRRAAESGLRVPRIEYVDFVAATIGLERLPLRSLKTLDWRSDSLLAVRWLRGALKLLAELRDLGIHHGDALLKNFALHDDGKLWVLDFEYERSGVSDPHDYDLLTLVADVLSRVGPHAIEAVLDAVTAEHGRSSRAFSFRDVLFFEMKLHAPARFYEYFAAPSPLLRARLVGAKLVAPLIHRLIRLELGLRWRLFYRDSPGSSALGSKGLSSSSEATG